jgi:hypothetical protein
MFYSEVGSRAYLIVCHVVHYVKENSCIINVYSN